MHTQGAQIKLLLEEIGRHRSIRDPIGDLANELTASQVHALLWLGHDGPLNASTLAQRIGVLQPSLTGIVDRLEKLGYVARTRGSADRRVIHCELTASGRALYERIDSEITKHIEAFVGILPEEEQRVLVRFLERLLAVVKLRSEDVTVETAPVKRRARAGAR